MFAKFSPDGGRVAYVHANDLWVEDVASGAQTRLTSDGSETIINGTFDWVYEEELGLRDGFRWSPDGERIAYWQLDAEGVGVFYLIDEHCEDPTLKGVGVAHEGFHAAELGLRGIPGAAEALGVERGVLLAELTGSAFHVAHMSARVSLRAVAKAKEAGVRVTCEVAPHHFTLTDESLARPVPYDTNVKMNPPLREAADRDAMLAGIADGTVDVIATDHAPHHYDEKQVEFDRAPFGIVGLETAVPLSLDRLVHSGLIPLSRLVELLSVNPARILRVPGGALTPGAPADLTILAPDLRVRIDARAMRSKSTNTPFDGWELRGGVAATIVGGRLVYTNPAVMERQTDQ
jgi:dihydroorotase